MLRSFVRHISLLSFDNFFFSALSAIRSFLLRAVTTVAIFAYCSAAVVVVTIHAYGISYVTIIVEWNLLAAATQWTLLYIKRAKRFWIEVASAEKLENPTNTRKVLIFVSLTQNVDDFKMVLFAWISRLIQQPTRPRTLSRSRHSAFLFYLFYFFLHRLLLYV